MINIQFSAMPTQEGYGPEYAYVRSGTTYSMTINLWKISLGFSFMWWNTP